MRSRYVTLDVFTDRLFGGNPLAVLPDARGLTGEQMAAVAREFDYSETVFVLPPEDPEHTRRLRIFTPGAELPFAGHPTVGTAHALAALGEIELRGPAKRVLFEEGVGPVPVEIRGDGRAPEFCQLTAAIPPETGPPPPPVAALAEVVSLTPDDVVAEGSGPSFVSCGVPFLLLPLRELDAVRRARLRRDRWEAILSRCWAPQVYLFAAGAETPGADVHARSFAPGLGVDEDPATGSAAATLAAYLAAEDPRTDGTLRWTVEQGIEIGRPSVMHIEADKADGAVVATRVGGPSVMVSEGSIEVG